VLASVVARDKQSAFVRAMLLARTLALAILPATVAVAHHSSSFSLLSPRSTLQTAVDALYPPLADLRRSYRTVGACMHVKRKFIRTAAGRRQTAAARASGRPSRSDRTTPPPVEKSAREVRSDQDQSRVRALPYPAGSTCFLLLPPSQKNCCYLIFRNCVWPLVLFKFFIYIIRKIKYY